MNIQDHGIRIMCRGKIAATMVVDPMLAEWHPLHNRPAPWPVKSRRALDQVRAQSEYLSRNGGPDRDDWDASKAARIENRDSGQIVYLLDDKPINIPRSMNAEPPPWLANKLDDVRIVFALPGLPTVRAEKLWPALDQLWAAGVRKIDGHALLRTLP